MELILLMKTLRLIGNKYLLTRNDIRHIYINTEYNIGVEKFFISV